MLSALVTLAFAVLAFAAPLSSSSSAPCISAEFSLAMNYNGAWLSIDAIPNGTPNSLNLVGQRVDFYPGDPVLQNGTSGNSNLNFVIDKNTDDCSSAKPGVYNIWVPDLGERYGAQSPITATKNQTWPHFFVTQGDVEPQRTAASQQWYACNITVLSKPYIGLSWGVYNSNGSSPYGCEPTEVQQRFEIPCPD